ncbi:MAG: HNH endonuclease, partial [Acidimicrobiia bacterium]
TAGGAADAARALADLLPKREIFGAGPVCQETARRIACDATVRRLVMDGPSEVIDLGRSSRLVNRAMRRALHHRDRGCVFPGCSAPVKWCDAHHLVHWEDGGPTSLDNLVLLCRRHHVACHEGGWQLERDPVTHTVDVVTRGRPTRRRDGSASTRRDRTRPPPRAPAVQQPASQHHDERDLVTA